METDKAFEALLERAEDGNRLGTQYSIDTKWTWLAMFKDIFTCYSVRL
jgi:hypothetical protein